MSDSASATNREASQKPVPSPPITDWWLRLFAAFPGSPLWLTLILTSVYTVVSQIARSLLAADVYDSAYIWFDGLNGLLFALTPTGIFYLRGAMLRDLRDLQPVLDCSDAELEEIATEVTCVPARRLLPSVACLVLFFASLPLLDPNFFSTGRPALDDPHLLFFILRNCLTGWVVGHAFASEFQATRAYAHLGRHRLQIDLLDTTPLRPFARRGQRSALVWIGAVSLVSLFWLSDSAGLTNGIIVLLIIVMVIYSFFHSIRNVHLGILAEKQKQLSFLRTEIRAERGSLLEPRRSDSGDSGRLAGLLAYYDLVERAPEWPFDAPVVLRLSLFVLLGLGSWLGGALVERLLESVM